MKIKKTTKIGIWEGNLIDKIHNSRMIDSQINLENVKI